MKEGDIELLKRIAEYEASLDPKSFKGMAGWRGRDVAVWPAVLTRLCMEGLVEDGYESNSYHGYRLTEKARAMLATGSPTPAETHQNQKLQVPEGIFEDIPIGHDEVKELLRACLAAEKPVHVLLGRTAGAGQVTVPLGYREDRRREGRLAGRFSYL